MEINLNNIEELIFYDKKLCKLLPELKHCFDQWTLAKRFPELRPMGRRAIMDLLNSLENEHIAILENYFNTKITLDKLDYHLVKNYDFSLDEAEEKLSEIKGFANFSSYRNGDRLYLSFWR